MRNVVYIIVSLLLLISCEKVIDVDLNESDSEIVIEANISTSTNMSKVLLTKTGSYFGQNSIENISEAIVTIEDDKGNKYRLKESKKGIYLNEDIVPKENRRYKLNVNIGGEEFEANSKLNQVVTIDSLTWMYNDGSGFFDEGYNVRVYFTDPADMSNYYRIKVFEIDTLRYQSEELIIFDDRLVDGNSLEITLQGMLFDKHDTVSVELISLDDGAFEFFHTFQELTNINPGSAAPSNPTSNISNGALGYFSAWSSDYKTVIIKE